MKALSSRTTSNIPYEKRTPALGLLRGAQHPEFPIPEMKNATRPEAPEPETFSACPAEEAKEARARSEREREHKRPRQERNKAISTKTKQKKAPTTKD